MVAQRSDLESGTGCRWLMPAITGSRPRALGLAAADRHARARRGSRIGPHRPGLHRRHPAPVGMAERSPDIAIVVSELMTNALRHALPGSGHTRPRRPVRLGLLQQGPWVLCAVADLGTAVPVPRAPGALDETGRGLQMICAFSDLWGCTTPSQAGKVVWALFCQRLALPTPARYPSRPGRDRSRNLATSHNQPV